MEEENKKRNFLEVRGFVFEENSKLFVHRETGKVVSQENMIHMRIEPFKDMVCELLRN